MMRLLLILCYLFISSCSENRNIQISDFSFPEVTLLRTISSDNKCIQFDNFDAELPVLINCFRSNDPETKFDALRRLCEFAHDHYTAELILDNALSYDLLLRAEATRCIKRKGQHLKKHIMEVLQNFPEKDFVPNIIMAGSELDEDYFNFVLKRVTKFPDRADLLSVFLLKYIHYFGKLRPFDYKNFSRVIDYIVKMRDVIHPSVRNSLIKQSIEWLKKNKYPNVEHINKFVELLKDYSLEHGDSKTTLTVMNIAQSTGNPIPLWIKEALKKVIKDDIITNIHQNPHKKDIPFFRTLLESELRQIFASTRHYWDSIKIRELTEFLELNPPIDFSKPRCPCCRDKFRKTGNYKMTVFNYDLNNAPSKYWMGKRLFDALKIKLSSEIMTMNSFNPGLTG